MMITVVYPWTKNLLKNHAYGYNPRGGVYLKAEVKKEQEKLIWKIKMLKPKFYQNKVWIRIDAAKPDHRSGDAINLVDRCCDAIKQAIGIDDRWYCINYVTWEIKPNHPKIYIVIEQREVDQWDASICKCGELYDPLQSQRKTKCDSC